MEENKAVLALFSLGEEVRFGGINETDYRAAGLVGAKRLELRPHQCE
jgi:hypothetical protein